MYWIYFLTRKFKSLRNRKGIRLIWHLAVFGVALGVTTLLLTQSVLSGFEKVFQETILGFNAHLVVLKLDEMQDPEQEMQWLRKELGDQLKEATPFFYREGLMVSKGRVKGAVLKGINPLTFARVYDVKVRPLGPSQVPAKIEDLLKSSDGIPNVILGEDLAQELDLARSGEKIRVFLPREESGTQESGKRFQLFRVAGIFSSGLKEFDQGFALVDAESLQKLYGALGTATGIEIKIRDPEKAEYWAARLKKLLGMGYDAISWQKLNRPLFQALRMERTLFFVIMAMVVAVAAFNIIGVLLLMIFDKSREISILRAMGAPYGGLKRVFAFQGLWIGALGCFWGLVLGGLLAWMLKTTQWFRLAKEVYFIEELPVEFSPWVALSVVGASLLIAYLATQFAVARLNKSPLDL